jgi:hypothetical protein
MLQWNIGELKRQQKVFLKQKEIIRIMTVSSLRTSYRGGVEV